MPDPAGLPRPSPRDVRDVLHESLEYLQRIRGWSRTLDARRPELAPVAGAPKDPLAIEDVRRLREQLANDVPGRIAVAADSIAAGASALATIRREIDRGVRHIVTLAHAAYGERLIRHARKALRSKDDFDPRAEDVVSETWLAFITNLPNFSGRCGIYTYLLTILDHVLIRRGVDYVKQARDKVVGEDGEAGEVELAAPMVEPLGDVESQQDKERMARALIALASHNTLQFQRLCLYYLLGLEAKRIADIEGKDPGGIRKGLYDARKALRVHLERVDAPEGLSA